MRPAMSGMPQQRGGHRPGRSRPAGRGNAGEARRLPAASTEVAERKDDDGNRSGHGRAPGGDHRACCAATIGHDFSQYKEKTLVRRIQRRMQVLHIDNVPRLHRAPARRAERGRSAVPRAPHRRDAVLPRPGGLRGAEGNGHSEAAGKAKETADDPVRIWVPGCATGEEVYSIAILLREAMERRGVTRKRANLRHRHRRQRGGDRPGRALPQCR